MATVTATAAVATKVTKAVEQGVFANVFEYSMTAISNGDVVNLGKVQHGTTVLAVQKLYNAGAGNDIAATLTIGSTTLSSATAASGVAWETTANLPYTVSVSDDAAVRYEFVAVTAAVTSASATGSIGVLLLCTRDT